jgi:hypothetical protein
MGKRRDKKSWVFHYIVARIAAAILLGWGFVAIRDALGIEWSQILRSMPAITYVAATIVGVRCCYFWKQLD